MLATAVLGAYVDYYAAEMTDRIVALFGSAVLAYAVGYVLYTLPAVAGWYDDPILSRALFLRGLKRVFVFWSVAFVVLVAGTFVSYLLRGTYLEITR